jgi:hypothetical protein
VAAEGGRLEIECTVRVADLRRELFHVTTDIGIINQWVVSVKWWKSVNAS